MAKINNELKERDLILLKQLIQEGDTSLFVMWCDYEKNPDNSYPKFIKKLKEWLEGKRRTSCQSFKFGIRTEPYSATLPSAT